ncbi:Methyltransferase-like protein 17, mitochondrial [Thoreauomyces humboldtii]|nr:Methyltransferase-like protein 17, mitochondrial [Thoreauomyces humboldtii]
MFASRRPLQTSRQCRSMMTLPNSQKISEAAELPSTPVARFSPEVRFGKNKIGWIGLPDNLVDAIDAELAGCNRKQLKRDVERLHLALRSTGSAAKLIKYARADGTRIPLIDPHTIQYGSLETQAYVASRTPPAYAAAFSVLSQVAKRCPEFRPSSCLDFGTGPGTALWAINNVWNSVQTNVGIDLSEHMLAAATRLSKATPAIKGFSTRRYLASGAALPKSDLVVASFALGDLASDAVRKATVENLWSHTADMFVLIERGTPEGFLRIANARREILELEQKALEEDAPVTEANGGVHIVAPCPHALTCPMLAQSSWCHFSQRIHKSRWLMETAAIPSAKNHQDIKFSYVVLRRGPAPLPSPEEASAASLISQAHTWPRLIAPPMKRDKHVVMDYCGPSGNLERTIISKAKSGKAQYSEARKSAWGDLWPHTPKGTVTVKLPSPSSSRQHSDPDEPLA